MVADKPERYLEPDSVFPPDKFVSKFKIQIQSKPERCLEPEGDTCVALPTRQVAGTRLRTDHCHDQNDDEDETRMTMTMTKN